MGAAGGKGTGMAVFVWLPSDATLFCLLNPKIGDHAKPVCIVCNVLVELFCVCVGKNRCNFSIFLRYFGRRTQYTHLGEASWGERVFPDCFPKAIDIPRIRGVRSKRFGAATLRFPQLLI